MKPLVQHLQDDINAVIDKYRDEGVTVAETIGALEITKLDLFQEQLDDEPDF